MSLASSAAYTERCLAAFRRSLSAAPAGCFAWATRAALIGAPTEDSDAFPRRVDHMQTTQSRPAQVFEHSANPGTLGAEFLSIHYCAVSRRGAGSVLGI